LVTARQQLRKKALLGNGWPQQYEGRVFYGVGSQAINPNFDFDREGEPLLLPKRRPIA
jgi:hypothetical protein